MGCTCSRFPTTFSGNEPRHEDLQRAAAVVNAVYHATGVRVRDLPVTCDKLLDI